MKRCRETANDNDVTKIVSHSGATNSVKDETQTKEGKSIRGSQSDFEPPISQNRSSTLSQTGNSYHRHNNVGDPTMDRLNDNNNPSSRNSKIDEDGNDWRNNEKKQCNEGNQESLLSSTRSQSGKSTGRIETPHARQCTVDDSSKSESNSHLDKESKPSSNDDDKRTSKDYYFDSYAHHGIHEEMLKDTVRTQTYRNAIISNPHIFENKIVLDVGCGTGILSMFAAQAGARHVYGIDCSNIIDQAETIVKLNGFQDHITLIKGKVEEVDLASIHRCNPKLNIPSSSSSQRLPIDETEESSKHPSNANGNDHDTSHIMSNEEISHKDGEKIVDVIISEWMGYFLLYESMLDTVLYARDRWLINDGIMLPDKAIMYIGAVEDGLVKSERIDFWTNVYGFDMTPLKRTALREPIVDTVEGKALVTNTVPILNLDLLSCKKEDLSFSSDFRLRASRNDYIHGFVSFFECAFTQLHKPIGFSTSPFSNYTHWKQTLFYLDDMITMCKDEEMRGHISCRPNAYNNRDLDINLRVTMSGAHTKINKSFFYQLR